MGLTELERQVVWFRSNGVRYPAIARSLGIRPRFAKRVALSAYEKIRAAREEEARRVLATFGKRPTTFTPCLDVAPRPQLVNVDDLVEHDRVVLADLLEVG